MFTVDYTIEDIRGRFVSDLSFTFLHWNLMEQLESDALKVEQIDAEQLERLIYNILPGGDTVLHKLNKKGEVLE